VADAMQKVVKSTKNGSLAGRAKAILEAGKPAAK
jgi:hypothetical protein